MRECHRPADLPSDCRPAYSANSSLLSRLSTLQSADDKRIIRIGFTEHIILQASHTREHDHVLHHHLSQQRTEYFTLLFIYRYTDGNIEGTERSRMTAQCILALVVCISLLVFAGADMINSLSGLSALDEAFTSSSSKAVELLKMQFAHHPQVHIFLLKSSTKDTGLLYEEYYQPLLDGVGFYDVTHYSPVRVDRTCLLPPSLQSNEREVTTTRIMANNDSELIAFANGITNQFLLSNGSTSRIGQQVEHATSNLYVSNKNEACARLSTFDFSSFVHDFWLKQKPVVVDWRVHRDNNQTLIQILGAHLRTKVGVKLSDSEGFEGIEPLDKWKHLEEQAPPTPAYVLDRLASQNKVVVRAAHEEMALGNALNILLNGYHRSNSTTTAYIEYLSLRHLTELLSSLLPSPQLPVWLEAIMLDAMPYLWLGNGKTLGKLHFDAFDNLLIQLEGEKTFKLVDPSQNEAFYEGHIREAELGASIIDEDELKVVRKKLSASTSLVHSPVFDHLDEEPDVLQYPLAKAIPPKVMTCTVREGESLFVPSFWWHEVQSSPGKKRHKHNDKEGHLNVAINYWFAPLFEKEFPCPSCRKKLNPRYRDILQKVFSA